MIFKFHKIELKPRHKIYERKVQVAQDNHMKKYGVSNPMQRPEIKAKSQQRMLENNNGVHPLSLSENRERALAIRREKFKESGGSIYNKRAAILEERGFNKEAIIEVWKENNFHSSELQDFLYKDISEEKHLSRRQFIHLLEFLEIGCPDSVRHFHRAKAANAQAADNSRRLALTGYDFQKLTKEFIDDDTITFGVLTKKINKLLPDNEEPFTERQITRFICNRSDAKERNRGQSRVGKHFGKFLETVNPNFETNDRKIIAPYELDFVFEDLKVAIEFNGDYWHSDRFLIPNHGMDSETYHGLKNSLARKTGFTLLFIWESDWVDSESLIKKELKKFFEDVSQPVPEIFKKFI